MRRVRAQLTYANVVASLAMFVALGGTTYAVASLPRNSVGVKQIRTNAVGASELRRGAVRSAELRDRSIRVRDMSFAARSSLRGAPGPPGPVGAAGPPGPPGVPLSAAVGAGGNVVGGTPGVLTRHDSGSGDYDVRFERDLQGCRALATLSRVAPDEPQRGEITTATTARGVFVRTRSSSGAPMDLPFHLIVVC
jgi:hypothetical protein